MPLNMRAFEVTDGSITSAKLADAAVSAVKLADNAVDLGTVKVTGSLPSTKLADGAIDLSTAKVTGELPSGKIAAGAITSTKLADGSVIPSKASSGLKTVLVGAVEGPLTAGGPTPQTLKTARFIKAEGIYNLEKMVIGLEMKTSNAASAARVRVFMNGETTERLELSSISTSLEHKVGTFTISDLAEGIHSVTVKALNDGASDVTTIKLTEIHQVAG